MDIKKLDKTSDRLILQACINNDKFLEELSQVPEAKILFLAESSNKIVKWCLSYYNQYSKAPKVHIRNILDDDKLDDDTIDLLEALLISLEGISTELNVSYLFDQAVELINLQKLGSLEEAIRKAITQKDFSQAQTAINALSLVQKGKDSTLSPMEDNILLKATISADTWCKPLFQLPPGELGELMNMQFTEESFITFLGFTGRKKSWVLLDLLFQAYRGKCNVILFECGDLSKNQVLRRMYGYLAGQKAQNLKIEEVESQMKRWSHFTKGAKLKLSIHPSGSLTIKGIRTKLEGLEQTEGFVPHVIVVDYADLLAPEDPKKEFRHQQRDIWQGLRRLSQDYKCCLITATQSNRSGDTKTLKLSHISEDINKAREATAIFGLDLGEDESEFKITELKARDFSMKLKFVEGVTLKSDLDSSIPIVSTHHSTRRR